MCELARSDRFSHSSTFFSLYDSANSFLAVDLSSVELLLFPTASTVESILCHFLVRILSVPAHFALRAGNLLRTSSCRPVTRATQLDISSLPFAGLSPPSALSHTSVLRAYNRVNFSGLRICFCPFSIDALGSSLILERQASF